MHRLTSIFLAGLLSAGLAGCTEDLTTPGSCPQTCPGGIAQLLDTVIYAVPDGDSSFVGYQDAGGGSALLVSAGLAAGEFRSVIRFGRRQDSVLVDDTLRAYSIDSVALVIGVVGRDSLQPGIWLHLYRMPATVDSTVTFADVEAMYTPENFIDSVPVPDTLHSGTLRTVLTGTALERVEILAVDSGVLALAVRTSATAATGVRIGSRLAGSLLPTFFTYASATVADTSVKQTIARSPSFDTFVEQFPPGSDPDLLLVGSAPSARALLRFALPPGIRDSAQILKAVLQLLPVDAVPGLPNDPATLQVRGVLTDLGAKSPLISLLSSVRTLETGVTDTVGVEVASLVRTWQVENPAAEALMVILQPEASTFTRPVFGSTRAGPGVPRIRITYVLPFGFQDP
jgi:hypothetical protein